MEMLSGGILEENSPVCPIGPRKNTRTFCGKG